METNLDDDESKLDISWINEQSRIQNIHQNYFKEPIDNITVYSLFINKNLYIDNIKCDKLPVEKNGDTQSYHISSATILKMIQTHKTNKLTTHYKLKEILTYIIDTNPEDIQEYVLSNDTDSKCFLQTYNNMVDEIQIPESIFIFHNINSIYFLFQEKETDNHNHTYKSILKTDNRENPIRDNNTTKKVRIQDKIKLSQRHKSAKSKYTRKHKKQV
jgi:hypothetical protein